ncbi:F-box/WD repeat-containing protein 7 [Homalodisca vitripennis]|nr:F-box/WD repeat-containing protein 7 [Homalodisca vitripennis]
MSAWQKGKPVPFCTGKFCTGLSSQNRQEQPLTLRESLKLPTVIFHSRLDLLLYLCSHRYVLTPIDTEPNNLEGFGFVQLQNLSIIFIKRLDDRVVSGSRDATLRVWHIDSGECLHVLVGHLAAVRCVQYDGRLVVSGAYDYMVKVWNPEREECLHTLQGHTNRVYSLQFDGVHVVSGSLDTSIRVWEVETGACRHTLMGHQSLTSGMELRNNILVSGNADSTVKVWDILTGQCLQTLSGKNIVGTEHLELEPSHSTSCEPDTFRSERIQFQNWLVRL